MAIQLSVVVFQKKEEKTFSTAKLCFCASWLRIDGATRDVVLTEPCRRVDESHLKVTGGGGGEEGRVNLANFLSARRLLSMISR